MSADLQQIIRSAWREFSLISIEINNVKNAQVLNEIKKMGVTVHTWDEKELKKVRKVAQSIWKEEAQKSPMAQKAYDAYMDWLEKLGTF